MQIEFQGKYKSLTDFGPIDLPDLTIISGKNGAGKTQILEAIHVTPANSVIDANPNSKATLTGVEQFQVSKTMIPSGGWNLGGIPATSIQAIQNHYTNIFQQIVQSRNAPRMNKLSQGLKNGLERYLDIADPDLDIETLIKKLPENFVFENLLNPLNLLPRIGLNFHLEALEKRINIEDYTKEKGGHPFKLLEIFFANIIPQIEIEYPSKIDIRNPNYIVKFIDSKTSQPIQPDHMSSGEKVLLRLILWQYFASTDGEFPKLLLLDEPDAHLHPTMTQDFLSTIQDIIINKMGSKVIMTTHSPTTIALAPEESIYWMDRDGIRLQKRGKSDVLRELSEGLILVSENTCNVVVEDKDDVKFYNSIRDQLIHLKLIAPTPYLKFSPSSKANATGGRDVAIQDAKKVRAFMGKKALVALVDMDYEAPQETPFFTNRYSIENYLYDPLIIHCWRVDNGKKTNTKLATAKLKGRVADLLSLETRQLQNIIDHYCDQIEKFISFDECVIKNPKTTQKVQISDTITLSYPRWFLYMKGKDIGKAYKDVYSDHPSFQPLFSLIGNIPSLWPEFIDTFKRIQSSP